MISFKFLPIRHQYIGFFQQFRLSGRYILYLSQLVQLKQLPSYIAKIDKYPVTESKDSSKIQLDPQPVPDEGKQRRKKGVSKEAREEDLDVELAVQRSRKTAQHRVQSGKDSHRRVIGISLRDVEWKKDTDNQPSNKSKYRNHLNHLNPV